MSGGRRRGHSADRTGTGRSGQAIVDRIAVIRAESQRFADALAGTAGRSTVRALIGQGIHERVCIGPPLIAAHR